MNPASRLRRGFLVMDFALALTIALVALMALTAAVGRMTLADRKLGEVRAATRRLETGLLLAAEGRLPADLQLQRLADPAPEGFVWVRISARDAPSPRSLTGLVPAPRAGGEP